MMCEEAVENESRSLGHVPDSLKTHKMCNKAVQDKPWLLKYVPDWFVIQKQIDIWYDDDYVYNDNFFKW